MAHVERRPLQGRLAEPQNKTTSKSAKHKIVLESVTQEKKKLYSILSFDAEPPKGYTFVPAGNPALTTQCKEMSRAEGLEIFAVSATPHKNKTNLTLSHQVHRVGYHFPSHIVSKSCLDQGLHMSRRGRVLTVADIHYPFETENTNRAERAGSAEQIELNTGARDTIKDLFPSIPEKDLTQIVSTAFQKGTGKVGVAAELPLVRRAQLAVVAHVRHVYTNYDRLLRLGSYQEARTAVEPKTLEMLVAWRGSDENGSRVLEDTFREVIVLSDEEDSDDEDEYPEIPHRDSSIEIVSSTTLAHEVQAQPINFARTGAVETNHLSDEDAPSGYRIVPTGFRRKKVDPSKADRRGFIRYQAWGQALDRYRPGPDDAPSAETKPYTLPADHMSPPALRNTFIDPLQTQTQRQYSLLDDSILIPSGETSRSPLRYIESSTRPIQDTGAPGHPVYRRMLSPPDGPIRIPDGRGPQLFRLSGRPLPMRPDNEPQMIRLRPMREDPRPSHRFSQDLVYSPDQVREKGTEFRRPVHRTHASLDSTVLPSIEGPQSPDSPRPSGPLHQELKHRLPPALERDHAPRHYTPESDRRRGDSHVQTALAPLGSEEQRPRKRQRLLLDQPQIDDLPNKRYNIYHDERSNSGAVDMPYEEARQPLMKYLPSDQEQSVASVPPKDTQNLPNFQPGLPMRGVQDDRTQISLQPVYEPSGSHSAQLGRQNWDPRDGRVLVNHPSLHPNSPSLTSNPFDDTSPSVFRKDESFVRPVHLSEIVRPLSDVAIRDRDVQRSMYSDHSSGRYDHEVHSRTQSYVDEDPFSGRRIQYVPVRVQEADRMFPARGSIFSPTEKAYLPRGVVREPYAPRQSRAPRGPLNALETRSNPHLQLRQTVAPDLRPVYSSPLTAGEHLPAFPVLRRALRPDEYLSLDQSRLSSRPEREIHRDVPPTSQVSQYENNNEPLPRPVRYKDRVISSIPGETRPYYQPVPTRGEVIVLE